MEITVPSPSIAPPAQTPSTSLKTPDAPARRKKTVLPSQLSDEHNALIEAHLHLVPITVQRLSRGHANIDEDDLQSAGYIGLIKAARLFQQGHIGQKRGEAAKFGKFALWIIGKAVSSAMIQRQAGIFSKQRTTKADLLLMPRTISKDAIIADSDGGTIEDSLIAPDGAVETTEKQALGNIAAGDLWQAIDKTLIPPHAQILRLHYGGRGLDFAAIGEKMGVSRQSANAMHRSA